MNTDISNEFQYKIDKVVSVRIMESLYILSKVLLNDEEIKIMEKEEGFEVIEKEFVKKVGEEYAYNILAAWR